MTVLAEYIRTLNGKPIALADVPVVPMEVFRATLKEQLARTSSELSALFGVPGDADGVRIYAVVSDGASSEITICATDVGSRYPALTPDVTQAHWFERELAEQWGVVPEGHPWLKPIRFHRSYRDGHDAWGRAVGDKILPCVQPAGTDYFKVRGDEIHEVAVGPVHADGLVVTGPVTQNMKLALEKTYAATPAPKFVIAVGACAISGGPFIGHDEQNNGCDSIVPVDMYIPGCPPHPLTILDGILRLLGRIESNKR